MSYNFEFNNIDLERRLNTYENIKNKYPNKIPVIIEFEKKEIFKNITKTKFLVEDSYTLSKLMYNIRSNFKLDKSMSLFCLVNGQILCNMSDMVLNLVQKYGDNDDHFLKLYVMTENVFGNLI